jgi:8-amino-7-oxononanoate synthase
MIYDKYYSKLEQRKNDGLLRKLKINDHKLIDLCSNDYLGLSSSVEFKEHLLYELTKFNKISSGSGGSRLLSGNYEQIENLEKRIADKFNSESALLFPSGYQANMGLLSCIADRNDFILYDELCHASIKEGIRMSFAKKIAFKHNDIEDLKKKMSKCKGTIFVISESVFSMDGDIANIDNLVKLCKENNCNLIIDEAHAVGVIGEKGEGLVASKKYSKDVFARTITFGKAYACQGAAILCNTITKDYLINFSRPFIYTTAPSPIITKMIEVAIDYIETHPILLTTLNQNIEFWKSECKKYPKLNLKTNKTPIQKIIISGNENVKKISKIFSENGFLVMPVLYPTVAKGQERLRIVIHSKNNKKEFENFLEIYKNNL